MILDEGPRTLFSSAKRFFHRSASSQFLACSGSNACNMELASWNLSFALSNPCLYPRPRFPRGSLVLNSANFYRLYPIVFFELQRCALRNGYRIHILFGWKASVPMNLGANVPLEVENRPYTLIGKRETVIRKWSSLIIKGPRPEKRGGGNSLPLQLVSLLSHSIVRWVQWRE